MTIASPLFHSKQQCTIKPPNSQLALPPLPARNWRMKKPKRGVRSMEPSSGGTRPENSFRYGSVTCGDQHKKK